MSEVNNVSVRGDRITIEISDEVELDLPELLSEVDQSELLENMDVSAIREKAIEEGVDALVDAMDDSDKGDVLKALVEYFDSDQIAEVIHNAGPVIRDNILATLNKDVVQPEPIFADSTSTNPLYTSVSYNSNLRGVIVGSTFRLTKEDGSSFVNDCRTEQEARALITALLKGRF